MKTNVKAIAGGAAALALGLAGCSAPQADVRTATVDQIATSAPDPWAQVDAVSRPQAAGDLADGVYTGRGLGMEGAITATLLVQDNRITCIHMTQDGETPSVGGYEAIRDGVYARMIDEAQGSDFDAISGATITTDGVRDAVDDALRQARR